MDMKIPVDMGVAPGVPNGSEVDFDPMTLGVPDSQITGDSQFLLEIPSKLPQNY